MAKTAVILFNLGGPDSLPAVQPFLFNLFTDKAIIRLPWLPRMMLAALISTLRTKKAKGIYSEMGGRSPILPQTELQAEALQKALNKEHNAQGAAALAGGGGGHLPPHEYKVFIAMRYWHPMTSATVKAVKAYAPDKVILLPLYPQFSTTTTASSFEAWEKEEKKQGLTASTTRICCYPTEENFIRSHVALLRPAIEKAKALGPVRVLFSAHGLPEKYIKAGDSYQWQVEQTVGAVLKALNQPELDSRITYQSRVGRLVWIGPPTEEEIEHAAREKKSLVIVPIAFVSEHSETLVELDIEYAELAHTHGASGYTRVPALTAQADYITSLATMVKNADTREGTIAPNAGARLCPVDFSACPCKVAA